LSAPTLVSTANPFRQRKNGHGGEKASASKLVQRFASGSDGYRGIGSTEEV
jgi:hypothetical protein